MSWWETSHNRFGPAPLAEYALKQKPAVTAAKRATLHCCVEARTLYQSDVRRGDSILLKYYCDIFYYGLRYPDYFSESPLLKPPSQTVCFQSLPGRALNLLSFCTPSLTRSRRKYHDCGAFFLELDIPALGTHIACVFRTSCLGFISEAKQRGIKVSYVFSYESITNVRTLWYG